MFIASQGNALTCFDDWTQTGTNYNTNKWTWVNTCDPGASFTSNCGDSSCLKLCMADAVTDNSKYNSTYIIGKEGNTQLGAGFNITFDFFPDNRGAAFNDASQYFYIYYSDAIGENGTNGLTGCSTLGPGLKLFGLYYYSLYDYYGSTVYNQSNLLKVGSDALYIKSNQSFRIEHNLGEQRFKLYNASIGGSDWKNIINYTYTNDVYFKSKVYTPLFGWGATNAFSTPNPCLKIKNINVVNSGLSLVMNYWIYNDTYDLDGCTVTPQTPFIVGREPYVDPSSVSSVLWGLTPIQTIYPACTTINNDGFYSKFNVKVECPGFPAKEDTVNISQATNGQSWPLNVSLMTDFTTTTTTTTIITTTTLGPISIQCSTDYDCPDGLNQYCQITNYSGGRGLCVHKKQEDSSCFRNHECLNNRCTTHELNQLNYPITPYNQYNIGRCINSTISSNVTFSIAISPSTLKAGQIFYTLGLIEGTYLDNYQCYTYIGSYNSSSGNLAWGYQLTQGNLITTQHEMELSGFTYNPPSLYYINLYELTSNSTLKGGAYEFTVKCIDNKNNIFQKTATVTITNSTTAKTKIDVIEKPVNVLVNSINRVAINYQYSFNLSKITNGECMLRGENKALNKTLFLRDDGSYTNGNIDATVTGLIKYEIWCNSSLAETAYTSFNVNVAGGTCSNNVKDQLEEGRDCGGICPNPCPIEPTCVKLGSSCTIDNDCCTGYCYRGQCTEGSCTDGIKNRGEESVDCGGEYYCPCDCITQNDCTIDGSMYCDTSVYDNTYKCLIHNCTIDENGCKTLTWYYQSTMSYLPRPTFCDQDKLCRFSEYLHKNNTIASIQGGIYPLSKMSINKTGTVIYLSNCDDNTNGFNIVTSSDTLTTYSFALQNLVPNIAASDVRMASDKTRSKNKNYIIPELCIKIPYNSESVFAKVNVYNEWSGQSLSKQIDTLTYRHNLKNSLHVTFISNATTDKIYRFQADNRSIQLYAKKLPNDEYILINEVHATTVDYNFTKYESQKMLSDTIYYLINTTYGEIYEGKYGSPLWMPIEWDEKSQWFKANFTIHGWMIWLALTLIIISLAYMSYKVRTIRDKGGTS